MSLIIGAEALRYFGAQAEFRPDHMTNNTES